MRIYTDYKGHSQTIQISEGLKKAYCALHNYPIDMPGFKATTPFTFGTIVLSDNLQKTLTVMPELKDTINHYLTEFSKDKYGNIPMQTISDNIESRYFADGTQMFGAYETEFGWIQLDTMACDSKMVTLVSLMKAPKLNHREKIKPTVEAFVKTNAPSIEK